MGFCLFMSVCGHAQKEDSLRKVIKTSDVDTVIARAYVELALLIFKSKPDSGMFFCDKSKLILIKADKAKIGLSVSKYGLKTLYKRKYCRANIFKISGGRVFYDFGYPEGRPEA